MAIRCFVADRQTGTFIEEIKSIKEGLDLINLYEEADREDGVYIPDFYDIVSEYHTSEIDDLEWCDIRKINRIIDDIKNNLLFGSYRKLTYEMPNGHEFVVLMNDNNELEMNYSHKKWMINMDTDYDLDWRDDDIIMFITIKNLLLERIFPIIIEH